MRWDTSDYATLVLVDGTTSYLNWYGCAWIDRGVAVVTFPWSRSCLDGHSGGMWGTIQDGMFQTAGFGTMTLHGVACLMSFSSS